MERERIENSAQNGKFEAVRSGQEFQKAAEIAGPQSLEKATATAGAQSLEKTVEAAGSHNLDKAAEAAGSRQGFQKAGNKVIAAADLPINLKMEDFSDLYSENKIQNDRAYVEKRKYDFQSDPELQKYAKRFERMFIWGVQVGRWLGNVDRDSGFSTQTFSTTEFDDYSQKIDAFTTLRLKEPYEADNGEVIDELPLAFDVTVTTSPEAIHKKLTVSGNTRKELPFGFSYADYYTNGRTKSKLEMCPRYVIGVTSRESRDIDLDEVKKNPLSRQNLEMRFQVLTEIRAQNELFEAMLPDDAYESEDPVVRKACAYIEAADGILNDAVKVCVDAMIQQKVLPQNILEKIAENPHKQRSIVEKYFQDQSTLRLRVEYGGKLERGESVVDTYNEITGYARKIADIATDPTGIGTKNHALVARERAVKAHNQPLELE